MTFFANLFLILFLLDGELSFMDELLSLFGSSNLFGVRAFVAEVVLLLAASLFICLGFDRRLPKRVFLPLIAYVTWCPVVSWFFPSLAAMPLFALSVALLQLLLFALPLRYIRAMGGEALLMSEEMLPDRPGSVRGTLTFWGAAFVAIPLTFLVYFLSTTNASLEKSTAGFMHLRPDGLYMTEKVYRSHDKRIRLIAMIHIGEKDYYESLIRSVSTRGTVVLAEGVSDRENLLKARFGYGRIAALLGLTSQETMRFKGRVLEGLDAAGAAGTGNAAPDLVRADVDLGTFDPTTVRFLLVLGRHLNSGGSLVREMTDFYQWAQKNVTPQMYDTIMNDILYRRNREVIGHLDRAVARYDTVVVPWGALHMPQIEEAVRARGFTLQEQRERKSIDFGRIARER